MREVIDDIDQWLVGGEPVALATVVETWGSAPRGVGAKMALTPEGKMAGSVSGGCVEGAVFEAGTEALAENRPRLLSFGVADETAWDVGLACGGQIEVFVEPLKRDLYDAVRQLVAADKAGALVTVIDGPVSSFGRKLFLDGEGTRRGSLGDEQLDERALQAAESALAVRRSRRVSVQAGNRPTQLFVDVLLPSPTLVMVGGVHIAIALASIAKTLGYRTMIIDPRRAFGSEARFPHVDQLIQAWPDKAFADVTLNESTAVAMLTHDPKIDDPALEIVLQSPAFYVGALGSTRTQAQRRERLLEAGMPQEQVNRIHGPIGVDIDAQTPEEIAVAVMAEIVAARNRKR